MSFITILFYVPQFLQLVHNKSPVGASLYLLAFLAPIGCSVICAGWITTKTGHYKSQIVLGFGLWAIAQGLLCTIGVHTSTNRLIGVMIMGGVGAGFTFQTMLLASQAAIPRHEQAVVSGVRSFVRAGGTTLALAMNGEQYLSFFLHSSS
jgi:fucose permease